MKINIAVIGAGWWGTKLIRTLKALDCVDQIIACDLSQLNLQKVQSEFHIHTTSDIQSIWNNPNISAVCIATSPNSHYELSRLALLNGKHVMVEKPPVTTLNELDELHNIAKKNNKIYLLDALYIYQPAVQKIKDLLLSNYFKEIRYVQLTRIGDELRRPNAGLSRIESAMYQNRVNVIDDLFYHDAGLMLYLCGHGVQLKSSEILSLYNKEICDTANLHYLCPYPVRIELSWTLLKRRRGIAIYDSEKILEYDAFSSSPSLHVHWLADGRSENIAYSQEEPLLLMLQTFIRMCSNETVRYPPDIHYMKSLMELRLELKDQFNL